jgi:toxin ParE1/3/4
MRYLRSRQAETDLDAIWSYVATESGSFETADRLIVSMVERFLLLGANPYLGRPRDEDLRAGIRSFPVGRYLIFYRIHKPSVLILRVTSWKQRHLCTSGRLIARRRRDDRSPISHPNFNKYGGFVFRWSGHKRHPKRILCKKG